MASPGTRADPALFKSTDLGHGTESDGGGAPECFPMAAMAWGNAFNQFNQQRATLSVRRQWQHRSSGDFSGGTERLWHRHAGLPRNWWQLSPEPGCPALPLTPGEARVPSQRSKLAEHAKLLAQLFTLFRGSAAYPQIEAKLPECIDEKRGRSHAISTEMAQIEALRLAREDDIPRNQYGRTLPTDLPSGVVVRVEDNSWMNSHLVVDWLKTVWENRPGTMLARRSTIVLDAFWDHIPRM
ncbi:hypothetical protein HPB47_013687 [Ixodes persulcatus]|uniref:Uncharacterized protein n=1 Tax=Ixodes persulcatus TaxID=34615 RepID=A0AC60QXW4_IXOPE|nr:hypothetical protein HPB47_013687 [Ixodes persulcatus]